MDFFFNNQEKKENSFSFLNKEILIKKGTLIAKKLTEKKS